jgi:hypothetical protein
MPILVDFNQVCISTLMAEMGHQNLDAFTAEHVPLLQHMIFNCLQSYRKKFGAEFGELIICTDNKSWRKGVFTLYKDHRRKNRDESKTDWTLIFDTIYKIKSDLAEFFPYRVFSVEGAEADDVIAVLCKYYSANELAGTVLSEEPQPILILSGDKDFIQLQKYKGVKQYSPILKKYLKPDKSPEATKREHILRGDNGDGVPNFRSPDNAIVDKIRQKPIKEKEMAEWLDTKDFGAHTVCKTDEEKAGYERNRKMIDLDLIPEEVEASILSTYKTQTPGGRSKIRGYFIANRMRNMIEISDQF